MAYGQDEWGQEPWGEFNLLAEAPTGLTAAEAMPPVLSWTHVDPDGDAQVEYQLRYREDTD